MESKKQVEPGSGNEGFEHGRLARFSGFATKLGDRTQQSFTVSSGGADGLS